MYICVCKAITDKTFQDALEQGGSYKDICKRLGVGSDCGICLQDAYNSAMSKNPIQADAAKSSISNPKNTKF